jgi:hypothetical protein
MKHHPAAAPLALVLVAGLLLPACGTAPRAAPEAQPSTPREVFLNKCSKCHPADVAYAVVHRQELWAAQVSVCSSRADSGIGEGDRGAIVAYFEAHPQVLAAVFSRYCGGCHSWGALRELHKSRTQWEAMIGFMGGMSGTMITRDAAETLCRGLSAP